MANVQSSSAGDSPTTLSKGPNIAALILTMVIDGVIPYLLFLLLSPRFPNGSVWPLIIAGAAPVVGNVISIVRQRQLDYLGVIVLIGIALGVVASLATGDPRIILLRESFFTGGFGLICLVSLLLPRPLMFFVGRHFATGNDPSRMAYFNSLWQYPAFRTTQRLITLVWGIGLVGEFVIRLILIYTLSTAQVLAVSPIILIAITIALLIWTMGYGKKRAREGEARRLQMANATQASQSDGTATQG